MRGFVMVLVMFACRTPSAIGYLEPPAGTDPRAGLGLTDRLAEALEHGYRRQTAQPPPPIRLAPTDGSELALRRVSATVTLEGPLAHTELHLSFHNAEPRTREGRFAITLPADAAVARFAMKVQGTWREARVVSRQRGREVYETFLHRKVDPALLEQDLGNQFSARVFPIFGGEDKEIILAYDERVAPVRPYTLALAGLPKLEQVAVEIRRPGHADAIARRDAAPDDVVVSVEDGPLALAAGEAFVARVDGLVTGAPAPLDRVLYLVDTSASRAPVMARQIEVLRGLLATHPADGEVAIAVFDHATTEVFRGRARDAAGALPRILAHGALGASNLGAALAWATGRGLTRLVLVGDGVPTLGAREPATLAAMIAGRFERVDAVQVGAALDRDTLAPLVGAGRQPGAIVDARDRVRVGRQLATAIGAAEPIRVDGATASWPPTTQGLAAGEPVWIVGRRTGDAAAPLVIHVGDRRVRVTPRAGDATRIARAVARAELAELVQQLGVATGPTQAALGDRIEQLALAHQLVSPRTSLLVLESDADELAMLGPREPDATPRVDPSATRQGVTLYLPTGRTFAQALGSAAGTQPDATGVSLTGATTIADRTYIVEGLDTAAITDASHGELVLISGPATDLAGGSTAVFPGELRPRVAADVLSPLALDHAAQAMQQSAFALQPRWSSRDDEPEPRYAAPFVGTFRDVMAALARGERDRALEQATAWQLASPGEVAAILALGEALEARGAPVLAARAYGSLVDLYPNRAELLRAAGERLDRIAGTSPEGTAGTLAIDAYRRARGERPDHVTTYRLLAYALLRAGRADEALDTLLAAFAHARRPSVQHVLAQDAGLVGAHLVARDPQRRAAIARRLPLGLATGPSLRFVLSWETDANDVDLHVYDRRGGHASYKGPRLGSGGRLLDDLTDGYGPEMFVTDDPAAYPYRLGVHYYSKGPMGIGLGTVQVIHHDGKGTITVDARPFAIQNDAAMVELGRVASR